ncbi:ATP-binding protein [Nocardia sp. NPDC050378]|uniref:AlbA family DNA-binding domain-containing protein n=1 Tax=Nocardia sp. NPDC050378 TaxID=3155400 RepID=UPI0033FD805F
MHSFPRLTALFGAPVDALTYTHLADAVARQIPEAEDLDFKQTLYEKTTEGKQELAKDVSALANAGGGVIILGIAEQNSVAAALTPVLLPPKEIERMQQICHYQIRPFLPGARVRQVADPVDPSTGFYVISVPRSADAPHAVIRGGNDNGDGTLLSYALRDGQVTRYLAEAEIARRYRDRFTSRAELRASLNLVHDEGLSHINRHTEQPWLTLAAYPSAPGTQRLGGSADIVATAEEVKEWAAADPPLPGQFFPDYVEAFPGVRRAVVTTAQSYSTAHNEAFAELLFNGSGFVATPIEPLGRADDWADQIAQDVLEINLHAMVSLLSNHASQVGAGGDFEFRAQLRLTPHVAGSVLTVRPAVLHSPYQRLSNRPIDSYQLVPRSVQVHEVSMDARTTANLDEFASNWRTQVRAAHALASDIVGWFAVGDTVILRRDGTLDTVGVDPDRGQAISQWVSGQSSTT